MGKGPIEDPQLLEIEARLNRAEFDEAQQLLASLGEREGVEAAAAYFATRLLYQRGRLDNAGVAERLREVLRHSGHFPQAENMLVAAELGVLEPSPDGFLRSTRPPFDAKLGSPSGASASPASTAGIPRAPLVPRFSPYAGTLRTDARDLPPLVFEGVRDTDIGGTRPDASQPRSLRELELELGPLRPEAEQASTLPPALDLTSSLSTAPPPGPADLGTSSGAPASASLSTAPPPFDPRLTAPVARSAAPDALAEPSLFEVSAALDAGDARRALELLAERNPSPSPEAGLLAARARLALGDRQRARRELEPLLRSALPPPLCTAAARLLIELGAPELAMDQVAAALAVDPRDDTARLTYAWALVRAMRKSSDLSRVHEVETLLATTPARTSSLAALALALRASLLAARGPATRALSLAQAALRNDPKQVDALAAVAIASIRLGLREDAERATAELRAVDPDEAASLARSLTQSTEPPPETATPAASSAPPLEVLWGRAEAAVVRGDRQPSLVSLEQACIALVAAAARQPHGAWSSLARAAAVSFTEQPVFRHFCPYDSSVFSIQRLAAALDLLFEGETRAPTPVLQVLGAYVGESVRQAYGGEWVNPELAPGRALIHAAGLGVNPCEQVRRRLELGEPLLLPRPKRLHPGADPFGNSMPIAQTPPTPWAPEAFPSLARLRELGRALPQSVVGLHCRALAGRELDHSLDSLELVDRYLDLLAPPDAPLDPDAGWVRRAALLAGAYVGEVLVNVAGGSWRAAEHPDQLGAYRVELAAGAAAQPAARVADRLSGRKLGTLSEYAEQLTQAPAGARAAGNERV